MLLESHVQEAVEKEGLLYVGSVRLGKEPDFARFRSWLERGFGAGMAYLSKYLELREDPRLLLTGAKSAVIFAIAYGQGDRLFEGGGPKIAQYARLRDYHTVMRARGDKALAAICGLPGGDKAVGRVVVDTAPILERALAARSGNGFVGKNTLFIHPQHGSFLLLGEIVLSADVDAPEAEPVDPNMRGDRGGCGSCRRCQTRCPTGALDTAYQLDANKCIAYWTIEHRGPLPKEVWPWLKHYVFGCDICQIVCPYNRVDDDVTVKRTTGTLMKIGEPPALKQIATMRQAEYEEWFGGTPMTRAKREGLMRNALVAMHVTGDVGLAGAMENLGARSDVPEVVRETMTVILQEVLASY